MTPEKGQIWREVDPRFNRFIMVLDVQPGRRGVLVQTYECTNLGQWVPAPRSRKAWCDIERFNGKRNGYEPAVRNALDKEWG